MTQTFEQQFDETFDELVKDRKEEAKKPPKVEPINDLIQGLEVVTYGSVGMLTSGKLGSQQQIRFRKAFEKFCNDMERLCDPHVNVILTNKIYYEHLKAKKLKDMK